MSKQSSVSLRVSHLYLCRSVWFCSCVTQRHQRMVLRCFHGDLSGCGQWPFFCQDKHDFQPCVYLKPLTVWECLLPVSSHRTAPVCGVACSPCNMVLKIWCFKSILPLRKPKWIYCCFINHEGDFCACLNGSPPAETGKVGTMTPQHVQVHNSLRSCFPFPAKVCEVMEEPQWSESV